MVRKILITIETDGDIDLEEYIVALEAACVDVEGRAMIAADCGITLQEVTEELVNGKPINIQPAG